MAGIMDSQYKYTTYKNRYISNNTDDPNDPNNLKKKKQPSSFSNAAYQRRLSKTDSYTYGG